MNIANLTDEAVLSLLSQITQGLANAIDRKTLPIEAARNLATGLVIELDEVSEDDGLGTEGWEHFLGVNL